jgi:hypothetical protein
VACRTVYGESHGRRVRLGHRRGNFQGTDNVTGLSRNPFSMRVQAGERPPPFQVPAPRRNLRRVLGELIQATAGRPGHQPPATTADPAVCRSAGTAHAPRKSLGGNTVQPRWRTNRSSRVGPSSLSWRAERSRPASTRRQLRAERSSASVHATTRTTNWRNCGEGRAQQRAKVGFQNPSRAQLRAR